MANQKDRLLIEITKSIYQVLSDDPQLELQVNRGHWERLLPLILTKSVKAIFEMGLWFHIVDREMLSEVGEWAERQDVGVFVYFNKKELEALKRGDGDVF